ncbi:MAG: acyltransferase family protein [Flavobacteriales bacterium]
MRIYFNGLNELRSIAAFAVVFHHIELFKSREKFGSLFETGARTFIQGLGKNGVYLFFVLSGFLITYLLLAELKKKDTVAVGKFYVRRILRIWPLYYLLVAICFFLLPILLEHFPGFFGGNYYALKIAELKQNFGSTLLLFLLFLPNLALILFSPVAGAAQAWSVGVEEQFYLIWPLLLKTFRKHIIWILFAILVGKPLSIVTMEYYGLNVREGFNVFYEFLVSFKIELMALGGIGAWFMMKGALNSVLPGINRMHAAILLVILTVGLYFNFHYLIMGLLFLVLIIFNINDTSRLIANRRLSFLGEISYGIYMYHPLMMYLGFCASRYILGNQASVLFSLVFYIFTVSATIAVSHLSFRFFESRFLRFKDRFAVVQSGKE